MKILHFPLLRITVAFILGILFFHQFPYSGLPLFIGVVIALVILFATHCLAKGDVYKLIFGFITLVVAFGVGGLAALSQNDIRRDNHYTNRVVDESLHAVTLVVHEKLKNTVKNVRYVADISTIDGMESTGKVILNIRRTDRLKDLDIGSSINLVGNIYQNASPKNPNQFDYAEYLQNHQIYGQIYVEEKRLDFNHIESTLWSRFAHFRNKIIQNLAASQFKKEELNVLVALLLGQQQDISPDVLKEYQLAGAVHMLSVSGLHVGFILLFVTFLLKPVSNSKRNRAIKLIVILLSLWSYGLLAGLAPSVVRSVTMFSFVAVGNHLKRTVNSFHTLLVSMLLILLWKPLFLFDVGFQLSYLALFFILWLQPLLSNIWVPKNRIVQYVWDIFTVSFAAQIGTLPLSLYYFHQFPGLFMLTNIFILPLLGIIMIAGLIVIIIACIGTVPIAIVRPLELLIEIQNGIVGWIASFEDFVLKDVSFTNGMLWSSYIVIIALILWLKKAEFYRLVFALGSILLLQGIYIRTKFTTSNTCELIVFHSRKSSVIAERKNESVTFYGQDSILQTLENNINVQSYLIGNFCRTNEKKAMQHLLYFKGKKILIIDSSAIYSEKLKPDILIIRQSPKLNMQRLVSVLKPKQIVADGSNYKSYIRLWEATCRKEKIPFHNTNEKGFYRI